MKTVHCLLVVISSVGASIPIASQAEVRWLISDKSIHKVRAQRLDIVGFLTGGYGATQLGGGAHYSLPLVTDGFIKPINDAFMLEFTALLGFWHDDFCDHNATRLSSLGGVRWDFFLTDDWTVFGKAKTGWHIKLSEEFRCFGNQSRPPGVAGLAFDFGVGAYWNFSEGMALRLETGVLSVLMVGLSLEM